MDKYIERIDKETGKTIELYKESGENGNVYTDSEN